MIAKILRKYSSEYGQYNVKKDYLNSWKTPPASVGEKATRCEKAGICNERECMTSTCTGLVHIFITRIFKTFHDKSSSNDET